MADRQRRELANAVDSLNCIDDAVDSQMRFQGSVLPRGIGRRSGAQRSGKSRALLEDRWVLSNNLGYAAEVRNELQTAVSTRVHV